MPATVAVFGALTIMPQTFPIAVPLPFAAITISFAPVVTLA